MNLDIAPRSMGFFSQKKLKTYTHKITRAEMVEDMAILNTLDKIKHELAQAYQNFDEAVDDTLIDVYIYEMKALNMKFKYYSDMCKARGLVR